jgi:hypothetical protein
MIYNEPVPMQDQASHDAEDAGNSFESRVMTFSTPFTGGHYPGS